MKEVIGQGPLGCQLGSPFICSKSCLLFLLQWLATVPPGTPAVPSNLIGWLKQQWTQDLRNVFFENFWSDRHFEIIFHSVSIAHPSLGLAGETLWVFYRRTAVLWGVCVCVCVCVCACTRRWWWWWWVGGRSQGCAEAAGIFRISRPCQR